MATEHFWIQAVGSQSLLRTLLSSVIVVLMTVQLARQVNVKGESINTPAKSNPPI
ncbi:MAG: hypothetical protein GX971_06360 [Firmicutes bacterium]|jgi:hypothetical protein|nr:hypothetical protein [Bacillota bacterium]NMB01132.1 hypothetical protein [Bacillota bacterium]